MQIFLQNKKYLTALTIYKKTHTHSHSPQRSNGTNFSGSPGSWTRIKAKYTDTLLRITAILLILNQAFLMAWVKEYSLEFTFQCIKYLITEIKLSGRYTGLSLYIFNAIILLNDKQI